MNQGNVPNRAAELRKLADEAKSPEVREQFLLMAADWERLAAAAPDAGDEEKAKDRAKPGPVAHVLGRLAARLHSNPAKN